ncbi:MAG: hypothetical protein ACLP2J_13815, partial [Acidimicrobiales bacterium]
MSGSSPLGYQKVNAMRPLGDRWLNRRWRSTTGLDYSFGEIVGPGQFAEVTELGQIRACVAVASHPG